MRTYHRTDAFWERVRVHLLHHATLWSKGSEGRYLADVAQRTDWQQILIDLAPASPRLSAQEVAMALVYKILIHQFSSEN